MEFIYNGKQTKKEIIDKSNQLKIKKKFEKKGSLLLEGDNFIVLSSLLDEYKGKIDLIYLDPPFNTSLDFYISGKRANTISNSKKSILAYSDKFSMEEYLEFIRERLIILEQLLSERGSIYLHIDYKIGHYIKLLMDEVFGVNNFKNDITRIKSNPKNFQRKAYGNEKDLILFYSKDYKKNIWNEVKITLSKDEIEKKFTKIDENGRHYTTVPLHAPGETRDGITGKPWRGIPVPEGRHWRTNPAEFDKMDKNNDIEWSKNGNPRIKKYACDHKGKKIQDIWKFKDPQYPKYPTQKNDDLLKLIISQSSDLNSIVLDCFAGSGTTLRNANELGRKWIGIDNSKSAINVIKKQELGEYIYCKYDTHE